MKDIIMLNNTSFARLVDDNEFELIYNINAGKNIW